MENSKQFRLNEQDLKKIGTGALVALVGALLTYLAPIVADTDFGVYSPLVVVVFSVLANTVRKLFGGN